MELIYNENEIRNAYGELTRELIARGLTISTMESATAGQLASLITDTEGSSAVMKGAFVTYCNEAKIMQGVPAEIIEKYSVYSTQTAEAMALACAKTYGADIGLGITGTMGNVDPANPDASEPGKVYVGVVLGERVKETISGTTSGEIKKTFGNGAKTCVGVAVGGKKYDLLTYVIDIPPQPTRLAYKLAVCEEVRKRLIEIL